MTLPSQSRLERLTGLGRWFKEAFAWRWRFIMRPRIHRILGVKDTQWLRVVMDRETARFVGRLPCSSLDALEISGQKWAKFGFGSYRAASYDEYDVCAGPLKVEAFDIVLMEQVLEHVLWPYRAVRHVYQMLRPGGLFVVTTPFLIRVHSHPIDCSRWTETGLRYLLAEGGFPLDDVITGSWGNRSCLRANFHRWIQWIPWAHSLRNEPAYPLSVWAFARKGPG